MRLTYNFWLDIFASVRSKFLFYFLLLVLSSSGSLAWGTPQVTVLFLDGPLDYSQESISDIIDQKATMQHHGLGAGKLTFDVHALNERMFRQNRSVFMRRDKVAPEFANFAAEFHALIIAEILTRVNRDFRLIHIPFAVESDLRSGWKNRITFSPLRTSKFYRKYISTISNVIRQNDVRVVNLSLISQLSEFLTSLESAYGNAITNRWIRTGLEARAKKDAQNLIGALAELIQRHPNVLFIAAAGNAKMDLSEVKIHLGHLQVDNFMYVAALHSQNEIADYSNRSPIFVDIAARGTIKSPMVSKAITGTSIAAPLVTGMLANIIQYDPSVSPVEAKQMLFHSFSEEIPALRSFVKNGRVLRNPGASAKEVAKILDALRRVRRVP